MTAYKALRPLLLAGRKYEPGDVIPAATIPARTLQPLLNLRRVVAVNDEPTTPARAQGTPAAATTKRGGRTRAAG